MLRSVHQGILNFTETEARRIFFCMFVTQKKLGSSLPLYKMAASVKYVSFTLAVLNARFFTISFRARKQK